MNLRSFVAAWGRCTLRDWVIPFIALLQFILHLWVNAHDNFFRDELYYLAAAQHLSPGYVEYPPFVALAAAFGRTFLGSSVVAIRLLPALAGALMVGLVADMVAKIGGGLLAQVLAALSVALGPIFIGSSGLLTMDPFDQLWWTLAAWLVIRMITRQEPRGWLAFGMVVGLGLLTKLTMAFFLIALLAGLLLSGQRKLLFSRWLLVAGVIALVIVAPYLLWQAQHGFPVIEYTKGYSSGKTFQASPVQYFLQQALTTNPLVVPLWLGGLFFLFFVPAGKPYRAFGWAYVFLYIFFMLQKAKFYWLSPAYPALLAGGAYGLELLLKQRPRLSWMQPAYISAIVVSGLMLMPGAIPILPTEAFVAFHKATGGILDVKTENLPQAALPQSYADRQGWKELVAKVKVAYDKLTPQEQAEACILTDNYGEAGAIDFYGPALGLPHAISGHNSYFIWGPQGCTGKVFITVNKPRDDIVNAVESVEFAGHTSCQYCMTFENNAPILIARGLKAPINDAWPTTKDFD